MSNLCVNNISGNQPSDSWPSFYGIIEKEGYVVAFSKMAEKKQKMPSKTS